MSSRSLLTLAAFVGILGPAVLGCNGTDDPNRGNKPFGVGPGAVAPPEFLYVANSVENSVTVCRIDPTSGNIANINSNNIVSGTTPIAIAGHPDLRTRFIYVGNQGTNDIYIYRVGQNGPGNLVLFGSPLQVIQGTFTAMKFRGDGRFLYVLTNLTNPMGQTAPVLTAYGVDPTTGQLTAPSTGIGGNQAVRSLQLLQFQNNLFGQALAIDRSNTFAYVALTNNTVVVVKLDAQGGLTLMGQPVPGGPAPSALAVNAEFLYAGSTRASDIFTFSRPPSGVLTLNPFFTPSNGQSIVGINIPITGNRLYSVNGGSGDTSQFNILSQGGVLQPIPPMIVPARIVFNQMTGQLELQKAITYRALAFSSDLKFAYKLDNGRPPMPLVPVQVSVYTVDGAGNLNIAQRPMPQPGQPPFTNPLVTSGANGINGLMPDGLLTRQFQ